MRGREEWQVRECSVVRGVRNGRSLTEMVPLVRLGIGGF